MASPHGRLHALGRRARERPLLLIVGLACAAAVLVEVGAFTGLFGLVNLLEGSHGAAGPDLNPYHERILQITSNITYYGSTSGYFPALSGVSLCGRACPALPRVWTPTQGSLPPEVGIFFWFNLTNTATTDVNLSVPALTTSGPVPTLFYLETYCCYTKAAPQYDELIDSTIVFTAGHEFGFEGYAFTTIPLPAVAAGGYTLYVNYTSN